MVKVCTVCKGKKVIGVRGMHMGKFYAESRLCLCMRKQPEQDNSRDGLTTDENGKTKGTRMKRRKQNRRG